MGGRIEIRGLRVVGTHGVLPEESTRAQPFQVDIVLDVDLDRAAATDDLAETVDYAAIAAAAAAIVEREHHALLERVAGRIAEAALADERVSAVEVRVAKLRPPVPHDLAEAAVTITRTR